MKRQASIESEMMTGESQGKKINWKPYKDRMTRLKFLISANEPQVLQKQRDIDVMSEECK
jgi:hypothetical protein